MSFNKEVNIRCTVLPTLRAAVCFLWGELCTCLNKMNYKGLKVWMLLCCQAGKMYNFVCLFGCEREQGAWEGLAGELTLSMWSSTSCCEQLSIFCSTFLTMASTSTMLSFVMLQSERNKLHLENKLLRLHQSHISVKLWPQPADMKESKRVGHGWVISDLIVPFFFFFSIMLEIQLLKWHLQKSEEVFQMPRALVASISKPPSPIPPAALISRLQWHVQFLYKLI